MNPVRKIYRRLIHAFDRHGWRLFPYMIRTRLLPGPLRKPVQDASSRWSPDTIHPFDVAYGVDTSGFVAGESLEAGSEHGLYNTAYYGISPSTLTQALDHLGLILAPDGDSDAWPRFTFVDLGCGKGRALLTASGFPFGRLIGVELSPELAEIARANTHAFAAPWQRSRSFEVVAADAAAFEFPPTPLVVFQYHPFLAPVLQKVLANLERSAVRHPREIYVLYANPTYAKVFARFAFLRHVWDYRLPFSPEDAAVDRHGCTQEHYALYRHLP